MGAAIGKWLSALAVAALSGVAAAIGQGPEGVDPLIAAVFVLAATKGVNWLVGKLG